MPTSPCERHLRICDKSGHKRFRPSRLLRAANDNRHDADHPFVATPESATISLPRERMPAIEIGSALSMLAAVVLATYVELEVITGTLNQVLDGLFVEASSVLW